MLFKTIEKILPFEANDKTILKEILHPKNDRVDLNYSLAQASLSPGKSSVPHRLVNQTEVYIFLKGQGEMIIEGEQQKVEKGDIVFVPKNCMQHVENQGDKTLKFLCIVSPPWQEYDDVVL